MKSSKILITLLSSAVLFLGSQDSAFAAGGKGKKELPEKDAGKKVNRMQFSSHSISEAKVNNNKAPVQQAAGQMQEVQNRRVRLERIGEVGAEINGEFCVNLKQLVVRRTIGKDAGSEEGTIKCIVGDQETNLFWKGKTSYKKRSATSLLTSNRYRPFVLDLSKEDNSSMCLFYGDSNKLKRLGLNMVVTESDEAAKVKCERAASCFTELAKFGEVIPQYGAAVTAGFTLASKLSHTIGNMMKDTVELDFEGNLDFKHEGLYRIIRARDKYSVIPINETLSIPEIDMGAIIEVKNLSSIQPTLNIPEKQEVHVLVKSMTMDNALKQSLARIGGSAVLEFNVGGVLKTKKLSAKALHDDTFELEELLVYEGKSFHAAPLSVSLVSTTGETEKKVKELLALTDPTKGFIKSIAPKAEKKVDLVFKAFDTGVGSVLAALAPSKEIKLISLGKTLVIHDAQDLMLDVFHEGESIGKISFQINVKPIAMAEVAVNQPAAGNLNVDEQHALLVSDDIDEHDDIQSSILATAEEVGIPANSSSNTH